MVPTPPARPLTWKGVLGRSALLLMLTAVAVAISMQGWRERNLFPRFTDLATSIAAADNLIHDGQLPAVGSVSSSFGRIPPGSAWLLVPGVATLNDPRLFEVPGSALLFLLTLIGIVLTGKALANETVGWMAAILYALSPVGLFFASSLWPRGHPFFVIWTIYFCSLAIQRSRPVLLLAAAVFYLFGTYVFIEIAPLGVVFVAAVLMNRRLLTWWALPAAAAIGLVIWAPYIRAEADVHFVDLGRLVSAKSVVPSEPNWCAGPPETRSVATGKPVNVKSIDFRSPPRPPVVTFAQDLSTFRIPTTTRSLARAAALAPLGPWSSVVEILVGALVFSFTALGMALLYIRGLRAPSLKRPMRTLRLVCGAGAAGLTVLLIGVTALRVLDKTVDWQPNDVLFFVVPVACLIGVSLWTYFADTTRLSSMLTSVAGSVQPQPVARLLLIALLVGHVLWTVAAPQEVRRFLWLWPIEALCIAFVVSAASRSGAPAWARGLVVLAVGTSVVAVPLATPLGKWYRNGWGGQESPIFHLLDRLADHHKATNDEGPGVSLTYDMPAQPFLLATSAIDARYSSGMAYDAYLRFKHGLRQDVTCADSYSPSSDYVIHEDRAGDHTLDARLEVHPQMAADAYQLLFTEGKYSLYARR